MKPVAIIFALIFAFCCCCCSISSSIGGFWKCTAGTFDPFEFSVATCTAVPEIPPATAKYVRLQQTTKKAIKISEMSIFDGDKVVSQGKTVKASSKLEGFSLQNLTTGGFPSDGVAGTTDSTESEYIEIDLGEERPVSLVYIVNAPDTPDGLMGCEIVLLNEKLEEVKKSKICEVEGQAVVWSVSGDALQSTPVRDPEKDIPVRGRYVKLVHTNNEMIINLAFVKVLDDEKLNLAIEKPAKASSVHPAGPMRHLTFGKETDNNFAHTNGHPNSDTDWIEIDLGSMRKIHAIEIYNRKDCCKERTTGIQVAVLDEAKDIVARTPPIQGDPRDKYTYTFKNGSGEWV